MPTLRQHSTALSLALLGLPAAAQTGAPSQVEEVLVYGRAQQYYLERESKIGTKVDTDIMDLPQSAQLLTEQLIIDQAARDITDLYRSIAGVSEFSYSGVTFRGFRDSDNVFYDGVRGDPYSGFSVPQLFNVERVEVLKGPASALYGGGEPGGMINYVTKKPQFEDFTELRLTAGDYDTFGGSIDRRGGLTDSVAYRLAGFYESQDDFRNNADSENLEIAGGLLFELGPDTRLDTTFDYIDQNLGGNRLRGVPVDDNGNFLVDRSYNANEDVDYQDLEAVVLQATLDHQFTDAFSVNTTLRYLENQRDQAYHESRSWVDVDGDGEANIDDRTIKREYRKQHRANEELSLTADFVYRFATGGLDHTFLFGGDYFDVDGEYDYYRARYEADGVGNLNIFDLNYGQTNPATYNLTDLNASGSEATRYSGYLQDQVELGEHWTLLAGLRYDHFEDSSKGSGYAFSDSAVTPRAGIVYKPGDNTSLYLNYSQSFNPTSLSDQEGVDGEGSLAPETGEQIEIGIKNQWFDGSLMTTLAIYRIDKEDVALANSEDTGPNDGIPALLNVGAVRSEGLEFTLVGDLTEAWTVTANYAYNDTRVVDGVESENITNTFGDGSRFVNAPKNQAGLWTRYALAGINSSIAIGFDYVSEQVSFDGQRVKPFTVVDASWSTEWNETLVQLNLHNLTDKEYAVSGFSERNGHFPGEPRQVLLQVYHYF